MNAYPNLRRMIAGLVTVGVFALIVTVVARPSQALRLPSAPEAPAQPSLWPMFGGSLQRNMVNTFEKNIPTDWDVDSGKNIKWTAKLGSRAYGGPVISGGKIFVGTNNESPRNPKITGDKGVVMCFRQADGKFLWQAVHDKLASGLVNDWPREGICSTPFVEGNRVYYVSNRCEVICADTEGFLDGKNDGVQDEKSQEPTDADIVWRLDMMKELDVFPHNLATSSPLIAGDILFVITSNGVDEGHINIPSPKAPSFLAINKHTGKVIWQDGSPGEHILHGQWSNPTYTVVNGQAQVIFPGGDGWVRGFDAQSGKLIWKFDCNPKSSKYLLGGRGTRNEIIATPVVFDNKVYIGVGQDPEHGEGVGHLWCIDITKTGDLSPVNDNFDPAAPENKNSGLVWHFGGPADAKTQEQTNRDIIFGRTLSTCAIQDGLVFEAELGGYLHCLDARTGKEYWNHDLKAAVWGSPSWIDGKVYIGDEDGDIFVFAASKEKKLIAQHDMKTPVKSTPVAVDGVLYIMTDNQLFAIQAK
jgi:outer membrane protein assembly factor BamB